YVKQFKGKESLTLKELGFYWEKLGGQLGGWGCVLQHCGQLKRLDFSNGFQKYFGGQEAELILMLGLVEEHCPNLTDLNFTYCQAVGDDTLSFLGQNFPNLTRLNLAYCRECTAKGIKPLVEGCSNLVS